MYYMCNRWAIERYVLAMSTGRSVAKTGAWVMDEAYLEAASKKATGCAEEVRLSSITAY